MGFTLNQKKALSIIPHFTGLLSVFGSISILHDIFTDRHKKLRKPYYRIILGLSLADAASSFSLGLSTWPIPKGTQGVYGAIGTRGTCTAQGLFIQLMVVSPFYNLMLSIYYLLLGKYQLTDKEIARKYEKYMHVIAVFPGVGTAVAGLPLTLYNNANLWCWIAAYPSSCEDNTGNHGPTWPCERGHESWLYRWLFFYGPIWSVILVVTGIMVALYQSVKKNEREIIELSSLHRMSSGGSGESEFNEGYVTSNEIIKSSRGGLVITGALHRTSFSDQRGKHQHHEGKIHEGTRQSTTLSSVDSSLAEDSINKLHDDTDPPKRRQSSSFTTHTSATATTVRSSVTSSMSNSINSSSIIQSMNGSHSLLLGSFASMVDENDVLELKHLHRLNKENTHEIGRDENKGMSNSNVEKMAETVSAIPAQGIDADSSSDKEPSTEVQSVKPDICVLNNASGSDDEYVENEKETITPNKSSGAGEALVHTLADETNHVNNGNCGSISPTSSKKFSRLSSLGGNWDSMRTLPVNNCAKGSNNDASLARSMGSSMASSTPINDDEHIIIDNDNDNDQGVEGVGDSNCEGKTDDDEYRDNSVEVLDEGPYPRQQFRRRSRSKSFSSIGSDSSQRRRIHNSSSILVQRSHQQHRYERSKRMFHQAIFYLGVFYLTWVFVTINRLLQLISGVNYFPLMLLHSIFGPLQGFLNFLVYRHGPCVA